MHELERIASEQAAAALAAKEQAVEAESARKVPTAVCCLVCVCVLHVCLPRDMMCMLQFSTCLLAHSFLYPPPLFDHHWYLFV